MGYSSWDFKELDTTEKLNIDRYTHTHTHIHTHTHTHTHTHIYIIASLLTSQFPFLKNWDSNYLGRIL